MIGQIIFHTVISTYFLFCEHRVSLISAFLFVLLPVLPHLLFIPLLHDLFFIYLFIYFVDVWFLTSFSVLLCLFIFTSYFVHFCSISFRLSPLLCRHEFYLCIFLPLIFLRFSLLRKSPEPIFFYILEGNTNSELGLT